MITRVRTAITVGSVSMCLLVYLAAPVRAQIHCDFEEGLGRNFKPVVTSCNGSVVFGTLGGGNLYYADINSDWYSVTSDNGKDSGDGEYFISGDCAGYVLGLDDIVRIDLACGTASWFSVGYSSQFPFFLNAYDDTGSLLAGLVGTPNTRSQGGQGLSFLRVTHPGIAYLTLGSEDAGGYWLLDEITTDAPVPEPTGFIVLAGGMALLGSLCQRIRQ